ncbi:MAG: hypothetical protein R3344_08855, partial [Acidobacteriota bacterium]|nr:hypothetical protein [Acidobacteriota bacterium]
MEKVDVVVRKIVRIEIDGTHPYDRTARPGRGRREPWAGDDWDDDDEGDDEYDDDEYDDDDDEDWDDDEDDEEWEDDGDD